MADQHKPLQIDRRREPRESLDTGFDPYVLSLVPDSRSGRSPARRSVADSSTSDAPGEAGENAPTRHRSTLIKESDGRR